MSRFFRSLFGRRAAAAAPSPVTVLETVPDSEAPSGHDSAPPWAEALGDSLSRASRAHAKLGLRVESLEGKLEAGFADLRGQLQLVAASRAGAEPARWDDLYDALDALDQAVVAAEQSGAAELATGLRGVAGRLARFLVQGRLTRVSPLGLQPDGRRVRVVGTVARPDLPAGVVVSVARAAVLRGDELVREGEVVINQGAP